MVSSQLPKNLKVQTQNIVLIINSKSIIMLVKNSIGTSDLVLPQGCTSWLNYWEQSKKNLNPSEEYACPACGKGVYRSDFHGCHVQRAIGNNEMFIIPLCRSCNPRTDFFNVENILMVAAPRNR